MDKQFRKGINTNNTEVFEMVSFSNNQIIQGKQSTIFHLISKIEIPKAGESVSTSV